MTVAQLRGGFGFRQAHPRGQSAQTSWHREVGTKRRRQKTYGGTTPAKATCTSLGCKAACRWKRGSRTAREAVHFYELRLPEFQTSKILEVLTFFITLNQG
jgi:hypothetical protein